MKAVTSEFVNNEKSAEALTAKNKVLEKQAEALSKKLEMQNAKLEEAKKMYAEDSAEVQYYQREVYNTQAALNKANGEIQKNTQSLEEMANATDNAGDELAETSEQAATFGDVLKANIIGDIVTKGIEALATGIKKLGKAMKDAVVDGAKFADEMNTMAKKTGLSTDALQEYKYMSDLVDVDLNTITGSLSKLTKNMATARKGTGDAATAFKTLGIQITDSNGELRNNQDVFNDVINALGQMTNETERDALSMQIFGKSAQELNPLIVAGGDAIAAYAQEAHDMGYVLDETTLGSLNNVNDSFDRLKNVATSVKNNLAAALAPTIEELASKMQDWIASIDWNEVGDKIKKIADDIKSFFNFISENGDTIVAILAAIAAGFIAWNVTSLIMGLVKAIQAFQAADEAASVAQAALNAIMAANPIGIVITALAALVAAVVVLWNTNEDFRNWCIKAWNDAVKWIKTAVNDVVSWVSNAWEDIKNFFKNAPEWFKQIGKNIIEGIWNGIKNMTQWLINKITGFFDDVVSAVKRFLGIQSPSKLFADVVGKNMALGVAEGWDKEFANVSRDINSSMDSILPDSKANVGVVASMRYNAADLKGAMAESVNAIGMMNQNPTGNLNIVIQADGREFYKATLSDFRLINQQNPIILNDF